jgi:hypothetical protein
MSRISLDKSFSGTSAAVAAVLALGLLAAPPASAGAAGGWTRNSTVSDSVTDNGNGTWTYNYTVHNTSAQNNGPDPFTPWIVDWELPWFGDAGITDIQSPANWNYSIETIGSPNASTGWGGVADWQTPGDPFYAGANSPFTTVTNVLHWYNECWVQRQPGDAAANVDMAAIAYCEWEFQNAISPDNSLDGFSFVADFDPVAAPYQASWALLPVRTGDPAFPLGGLPNSPAVGGVQAIPEPGSLALLGVGLLALLSGRRRRT